MSVFIIVRHGTNDWVGRAIAGRLPGVHLNAEGKNQVEQLADRLSRLRIDAVCSSPLERTMETAVPIAQRHGLEVRNCAEFLEVEAGAWSGMNLEQLDEIIDWQRYNIFRSGTRAPDGELMIEVQQRMVTGIERLREEFPQGNIVIVSHGDPIKAAIAHYLGISLDFLLRMEVAPASVSVLAIWDYPQLICMNWSGDLPSF